MQLLVAFRWLLPVYHFHRPGKSMSWLVSSQGRRESASSWQEGTNSRTQAWSPKAKAQGKLIWKVTVFDAGRDLGTV